MWALGLYLSVGIGACLNPMPEEFPSGHRVPVEAEEVASDRDDQPGAPVDSHGGGSFVETGESDGVDYGDPGNPSQAEPNDDGAAGGDAGPQAKPDAGAEVNDAGS